MMLSPMNLVFFLASSFWLFSAFFSLRQLSFLCLRMQIGQWPKSLGVQHSNELLEQICTLAFPIENSIEARVEEGKVEVEDEEAVVEVVEEEVSR